MGDLSVTEDEPTTKVVYLGLQKCTGVCQDNDVWISITTFIESVLKHSKNTTRISVRNRVTAMIKRRNDPIKTKLVDRDGNVELFNLLFKTGGITRTRRLKIIPIISAKEIFERLTK